MITVQNESRSREYTIPTPSLWAFDTDSPNVIHCGGTAEHPIYTIRTFDRVVINQVPDGGQLEVWLDADVDEGTAIIDEWWDENQAESDFLYRDNGG